MLYSFGYGVKLNYRKARSWLEKAADLNHAEAQYNLGFMYFEGLGVKRDVKKAKELLETACENELEKACEACDNLKKNTLLKHEHSATVY